jgi:hypothetical protein
MAIENAAETLTMLKKQWENDRHQQTIALAELQQACHWILHLCGLMLRYFQHTGHLFGRQHGCL